MWKWFRDTFLTRGSPRQPASAYEKHQDDHDADASEDQPAKRVQPAAQLDLRADPEPAQTAPQTPLPVAQRSGDSESPPQPKESFIPGPHTPLIHASSWQDNLRSSLQQMPRNGSLRAVWDGVGESPDSGSGQYSSSSSPEHRDNSSVIDQEQRQQHSKAAPKQSSEFSSPEIVTPPPTAGGGRFVLTDDGQTAGIANTVRKYLPNRAVVPHATPFDLRVDQALALERRQLQASVNDESAPFQWAGFPASSDK